MVLAIVEAYVTEHKIVSMQESTTGAVSQFLEFEGCECLQSIKLLSYLSGALQRYEEEGAVLNPKVILCNSIDKFSQSLPGGRHVVVGKATYGSDTGKKILKQCATLSRAGWVVFVERNVAGTEIKFGVLSFLASPTSVDLREMVALGVDASLPPPEFAVLTERIDPKTVLLTGARGNSLRIAFSTTRAVDNEGQALDKFAALCSSTVEIDGFERYMTSLLSRCLNESHGTILVVRTGEPITKVKGMKDAVALDPALDLAIAFNSYKTNPNAEAILELQRSEALLTGILQSDGIVVFDQLGRVSAYRVFFKEVRAKGAAAPKPASAAPDGGARRRAFEGLKTLLGSELNGALFRSQDGLTEFQGV